MMISMQALWIVLALVITGSAMIALLATVTLEAELLKIPAYKESNFLTLKFFIMLVWWAVPAIVGLIVCLTQAGLSH